ncbi:MAG: hypothetical protein RLN85_13690, partial [Pseudomonadales bacterium]
DAVRSELDGLRQKRKRPSRIALLDVLDGLVSEKSGELNAVNMPAQCDVSGPPEWQEICTIVARSNVPGCSNPAAWLAQVQATITGKTIQLVAKNRCVQDTTQHHLMDRIKSIAEFHGLGIGAISCLS